MAATETTIELAGLRTEAAVLVLGDSSETTSKELLDWLRQHRVAAAILDATSDEIIFSIAYSERGRIQGIGTVGELVDLMTVRQFSAALSDSGLGVDVSLRIYPDGEDPEGAFHDPAEDESVEEESADLELEPGEPELVYSLGPDGTSNVEGSDWEEEPQYQVWEFSRRGLGQARLDYLLNRADLRIGAQGQWSVFGLLDDGSGRIPMTPEESGLPLITARISQDDQQRGWVEVTASSEDPFGEFLMPLGPVELSHDLEELGPQARRLLTLLSDDNREPGSAASSIVDNPLLDVDEAALFEALGPSARSVSVRLAEIVVALGVPSELVSAAFDGEKLPQERLIGPASRFSVLADLADFGLADLAPRSRELNVFERASDWLRARPAAAALLVLLEAGAGLVLLRKAGERKAGRRLTRLGGGVLLSDACVDAGLLIRRIVGSKRNSDQGEQ